MVEAVVGQILQKAGLILIPPSGPSNKIGSEQVSGLRFRKALMIFVTLVPFQLSDTFLHSQFWIEEIFRSKMQYI